MKQKPFKRITPDPKPHGLLKLRGRHRRIALQYVIRAIEQAKKDKMTFCYDLTIDPEDDRKILAHVDRITAQIKKKIK